MTIIHENLQEFWSSFLTAVSAVRKWLSRCVHCDAYSRLLRCLLYIVPSLTRTKTLSHRDHDLLFNSLTYEGTSGVIYVYTSRILGPVSVSGLGAAFSLLLKSVTDVRISSDNDNFFIISFLFSYLRSIQNIIIIV